MIPEPLYRSLPYIYMAGGVFAAIFLESKLGFVAAGLLFSAGFLVLMMRYQARH